ncbi:MAG: L-threonylcarbamoyladenylate synthase [Sulfolobales archaeon]
MTKVVRVDALRPDKDVINEVANVLRSGGLCAFPTETVYGLGADGYNPAAIMKIFKIKGRPPDNPLIMHVSSREMFDELVIDVPEIAYRLINYAWPGPLTLVLKKSSKVPKEVTAGLPTVAVRCPGHPVPLELINALGRPIAAPSANLSGKPSPTNAEHVIKDLTGLVDLVLDGGETFFGVESTIIDVTSDPPTLLRPGPIAVEDLIRVINKEIRIPAFARGLSESEDALSPGTKYRHYSPNTPLLLIELVDYSDLNALINTMLSTAAELKSKGLKVAIIATSETAEHYKVKGYDVLSLGSRKNLFEVSHNLFHVLRLCDSLGADTVIVEGFNEVGLGLAVMNRLRKAAKYRSLTTLSK